MSGARRTRYLVGIMLVSLPFAEAIPLRIVPDAGSTGLTIFAAASLTDAFKEVAAALATQDPALQARFNFAGSQQLAAQLEQGAEADLYAPADQRWMTYAREKSLVAGNAPVFARNRMVVIVPLANPARIDRLQDLASRGIKLVLAAEAVPAGRYARDVLRNLSRAAGFASDYAERVLANVVSNEENVKAVVAKVQLGEADAGIVYRSDITSAVSAAVSLREIPAGHNVLATYSIALVRRAPNPQAARRFLDFLLSESGQAILETHGFVRAVP